MNPNLGIESYGKFARLALRDLWLGAKLKCLIEETAKQSPNLGQETQTVTLPCHALTTMKESLGWGHASRQRRLQHDSAERRRRDKEPPHQASHFCSLLEGTWGR